MGWWNVTDDDDVIIGDSVLDLTRHFIAEFSREYQKSLSRLPTISELQCVLKLAFKVNVNDTILKDFETLEINDIVLKTKKIPKRLKPIPGDIFSFKTYDNKFGFGRLISNVSMGMVAEFYNYFASQPIFDRNRSDEWLFPPVVLNDYTLFTLRSMGDWRIVDHIDVAIDDIKFKDIKFVYGPPNDLTSVNIDGSIHPISKNDAVGCRRYTTLFDNDIQELVANALGRK